MPSPTDSATYIGGMNSSLPQVGTSTVQQLDDFIRDLKAKILASLPNINGAMNATHTDLNYSVGVTSAIQTQLDAKAPLSGPTFTGTVVLPSTTSIGTVSATELGYVDGVTSAIQTQLDAKVALTDAGLKGRWRLITTASASASTTIDFTSGIDSTYDAYCVEILSAVPGTNNVGLQMRTSTNAGSSFDSAASDYSYALAYVGGTSTSTGASSITLITSSGVNISNTATNGGVGPFYVYIDKPSSAVKCRVHWHGAFAEGTGGNTSYSVHGGGRREQTTGAVNALRFFMSSGTIASGTFNLYGRVK